MMVQIRNDLPPLMRHLAWMLGATLFTVWNVAQEGFTRAVTATLPMVDQFRGGSAETADTDFQRRNLNHH